MSNIYLKQMPMGRTRNRRFRGKFTRLYCSHVIIDSKVSLTAYTEYVNAEDETSTKNAMKAHCNSIRNHAKKLASKNYEHMESINTLDFVLMAVPLEGAFIDAMRALDYLYEDLY